MKKITASLCLLVAAPAASFAQYFTDMFTGASINQSYWRTQAPFSDSSVTQSGGTIALTNAGRMITASSLSGTVDFTLKFAFTGGNFDSFRVYTRTLGFAPVQGFDRGIQFSFRMRSDPGQTTGNVEISGLTASLAIGTFPMVLNQTYTIRIVDDGTRVFLYVNDTATPFLQATDSSVIGRFVGFTNREGAAAGSSISAGSQVRISAFTVNSASVVTVINTVTNTVNVPDTSGRLVNLSTLGSGGFTMGFVVAGTTSKRMLIRAVGPTLQSFGVSGPASQTSLTVYNGATVIGSNSGWSNSPNAAVMSAIGGPFPLIVGSQDSAVLATLTPGNYTATVAANGATLVEVYEAP